MNKYQKVAANWMRAHQQRFQRVRKEDEGPGIWQDSPLFDGRLVKHYSCAIRIEDINRRLGCLINAYKGYLAHGR